LKGLPDILGVKNGQGIDLSMAWVFEITSLIRFDFNAMSCVEVKI
jgi:hypothetical protein